MSSGRSASKAKPKDDKVVPMPKPAGGAWIPEQCTAADLVALFGLSRTRISQLADDGVIVRAPGGRGFMTRASVDGYLKRLREQAAGRATEDGLNLADERAKRERVTREREELALARDRGEALRLAEVSAAWSGFAAVIKANILSLPGRLRAKIPHLTAHDAETIREQCRELLKDLAEEAEATIAHAEPDEIEK